MTANRAPSGFPPDTDTDVTASEVASYAYCAKAWHLRHVLEKEPSPHASARQEAGVLAHETHGTRVLRLARLERRAPALIAGLLLAAAALLAVALLWPALWTVGR